MSRGHRVEPRQATGEGRQIRSRASTARGLLDAGPPRLARRGREPVGSSEVDAKDEPRELAGSGPECILCEKGREAADTRGQVVTMREVIWG